MALQLIGTGLLMMFLSTVIHATFMISGIRALEWCMSHINMHKRLFARATSISLITIWLFLAIIIEVWLWALLYLNNPLITTLPNLETAFYFSMVTFTTLGYGDVVLTGQWRTLASIQAANGVIIFGWTTAVIFYVVQKVYTKE